MKGLSFAATLALSAVLVTGGSGCKKGEQGPATVGGEEKYTAEGPPNASLKVGDSTKVKLTITRTKGFDGPVEVELKGVPDKVTVEPGTKTTIGKENTSAEFTLKAANDAAAKDDVPLTIHTAGGGASKDVHFKLTIKPKG
jgi:hypothetical protein